MNNVSLILGDFRRLYIAIIAILIRDVVYVKHVTLFDW